MGASAAWAEGPDSPDSTGESRVIKGPDVLNAAGEVVGGSVIFSEGVNRTGISTRGREVSIQYSFPPVTAVVQMSLSSRYDWNEWATPIAQAIAAWTSYRTTDGVQHDLQTHTPTFYANDITEVSGLLISNNCHTDVVINWFIWA
ncbi:hypothetical protein ACQPW1_18280 [Nocardia sp. CA-128927]|uniref:hypothetical protein n=1 Tax=Nocardia sp. CA-128927 TaxID=3239975 RepID=UPI003D957A2B